MQSRQLGRNGPTVSALDLGCMGMSEFYGAADEGEAIATIHRALDLGVTLLDTADAFQGENFERNLELTAADLERIDAAVPRPVGDRYDETGMRTLNR